MIAVLWVAVVAVQLLLPEGHAVRAATGAGPRRGCFWAVARRW